MSQQSQGLPQAHPVGLPVSPSDSSSAESVQIESSRSVQSSLAQSPTIPSQTQSSIKVFLKEINVLVKIPYILLSP